MKRQYFRSIKSKVQTLRKSFGISFCSLYFVYAFHMYWTRLVWCKWQSLRYDCMKWNVTFFAVSLYICKTHICFGKTPYLGPFFCLCIDAMITSSSGNIFRVTGHVTRSFDVFFHLQLNKRLSKQWGGWLFETPSRQLWRHCNVRRQV